MEKEYWDSYYKKHKIPSEESPFAKFVSKYISNNKVLVELGCGNARDSLYFSKLGLNVIGIDQCNEEVEYLNKQYGSKNLSFKADDFTRMGKNKQYDYIYSRFTLHSIDEKAEERVLSWAYDSLSKNGLFFLELRSIKDDMFNKGKKIGKYESVTDHYRRFANFNRLADRLKDIGFKIEYSIESQGLAKYKDEDPVVIRFISKIN